MHSCLYVAYKGQGTTTTPFDMVVLKDLDRFHLVCDAIDRVASLRSAADNIKQDMQNKLMDQKAYIEMHGEDLPEIRNWKWTKYVIIFVFKTTLGSPMSGRYSTHLLNFSY